MKIIYQFFFILICTTSVSFAQDNVVKKYYDKSWFSSNIQNAYYIIEQSKLVYLKVKVQDGNNKKNSTYIEEKLQSWHENIFLLDGTLISSGDYYNGYYDGTWEKYYESGEKKSKEVYSKGSLIKTTSYANSKHNNNNLDTIIHLENDIRLSISYYENGMIESKEYIYKSNWNSIADTFYFTNGNIDYFKLYEEGSLKNQTSYNFDGSIFKVTIYKNDSIYETYYDNLKKEALKKVIFSRKVEKEDTLVDGFVLKPRVLENGVEENVDIYTVVEEMPRFYSIECENIANKTERKVCADQALNKYLSQLVYPYYAIENDMEAKEYIRFIVNQYGVVEDVSCVKCSNSVLTDTAIRIVMSMPKWVPGFQLGKNVKVQYVIPLNFKLY